MLKDIWESIEKTITERVKSPFAGGFILSWLAFNWQIPYYMFTVEDVVTFPFRLNYILDLLSDTRHSLWYPLFYALLFVTIYPFINAGLAWFSLWHKKLQNKINGQFPITAEEMRAHQLTMLNEKAESEEKLRGLITERDALRSEAARLTGELQIERSRPSLPKPKAGNSIRDNANREFSQILSHHLVKDNFEKIIRDINQGRVLTNYQDNTVAYLASKGIIERSRTSPSYHEFTEKGSKMVEYFFERDPAANLTEDVGAKFR